MSIKSLEDFLSVFCEILLKNDFDAASAAYHLPCIMMDKEAFIPCSKSEDILEFNQELRRLNISKYKGVVLRSFTKSVNKLSGSLLLVNVLINVFNDREEVVNILNVNINVINNIDSYSIVVIDFLNIEIPRIRRLVKYKAEEIECGILAKEGRIAIR
ncbi:MAG: hypothetical protein ACK5WS_01370 [Alphaproteobacteria bacterium]|jgi:hypothetical protein|nr:hypothetical protein [Candidatus Jidaibacter sp.]